MPALSKRVLAAALLVPLAGAVRPDTKRGTEKVEVTADGNVKVASDSKIGRADTEPGMLGLARAVKSGDGVVSPGEFIQVDNGGEGAVGLSKLQEARDKDAAAATLSTQDNCEYIYSQGDCASCIMAKPAQWLKRDLIPYFGPSYRCVWRHKKEQDYEFMRQATQQEAIEMIKADRDKWCPLAAYMAATWRNGPYYYAEEPERRHFECVEQKGSVPLGGAFSVALPPGHSLPEEAREHGKFRQTEVGQQCQASYAIPEVFMDACREERKDAQGNHVDVPSCLKYQEVLKEKWDESGEGVEDLGLESVGKAAQVAEYRSKKKPRAIEAVEKSPVLEGYRTLCGKFGHSHIDKATGRIFDDSPGTGVQESQQTRIERLYQEEWQALVANQARNTICAAEEPLKACGGLHPLLCEVWVWCVCPGQASLYNGEETLVQATDIHWFISGLPWRGGGGEWTWRGGNPNSFGKYKVEKRFASQIIVNRRTGELFLGDGHHRLMKARDESQAAYAYGRCED